MGLLHAIPSYKSDTQGEASPVCAQVEVATPNLSLLQRLTMETIPPYVPPFVSLTCCGTHRACAGRPSPPAPAWLGRTPAPAFAAG